MKLWPNPLIMANPTPLPPIEWPGVTVNGKIYGIPVIETDVADSGIGLRILSASN